MRKTTAAAIQMSCDMSVEKNLEKAEQMIRQAAEQGAQVILLPELFERPYFCQEKRYDYYDYALPVEENPAVAMGKRLAEELDCGPSHQLLRAGRKRALQLHRLHRRWRRASGDLPEDPHPL